jgi:hypothetical protein
MPPKTAPANASTPAGNSTALTPAAVSVASAKTHIPVVLNLQAANYTKWRTFFTALAGKFGLIPHITEDVHVPGNDPVWAMDDFTVLTWMYNTIDEGVLEIIMEPEQSALELWIAAESLFRDNLESQAFFLESAFRALNQDSRPVADFLRDIKTHADALRDVASPVSDKTMVMNTLNGLHEDLSHMAAIINSKTPFPSFIKARSMLVLEEQRLQQERKRSHAAALYSSSGQSSRGGSSISGDHTGGVPTSATHGGPGGHVSFPASGYGRCSSTGGGKEKQKTGPPDRVLAPAHQAVIHPSPVPQPGYWIWAGPSPTGPHAWCTPPAQYNGLLGPRPQAYVPTMAPSPQAYHTMMAPPVSVSAPPAAPTWDYSGIVHAMTAMHLQSPNFNGWVLDPGSTSNMLADYGILHSLCPYISSFVITIGNGSSIHIISTDLIPGSILHKHTNAFFHSMQCFSRFITIVKFFYI